MGWLTEADTSSSPSVDNKRKPVSHTVIYVIVLQKMSEEYQAKHSISHDSNHANSDAAAIAKAL